MNAEFAGPFRATISQELPRPPTFEVSATPHIHAAHMLQFERAVHPTSRCPTRRRDRPVRMIIERNNHHRLHDAANPQRGEVMKIPGAVKREGPEAGRNFAVELFDQPRRRGKAQLWSPRARVQPRQAERVVRPGAVKIDMERAGLNNTPFVEVYGRVCAA
jgi:hypothetical protein